MLADLKARVQEAIDGMSLLDREVLHCRISSSSAIHQVLGLTETGASINGFCTILYREKRSHAIPSSIHHDAWPTSKPREPQRVAGKRSYPQKRLRIGSPGVRTPDFVS